ncbi:hypothetical protein FRB94_011017 [Tulasnella sp. JGI-2019a]|nr:hypothetical protein FRB94_011017 [Tulasnella sp. JGI-2019a]
MENLMPTQESKRAVIDVSTTFAPDSRVKDAAPDTIIYTSDGTFFFCHQTILKSRSSNNFAQMVPASAAPSTGSSGSSTRNHGQVASTQVGQASGSSIRKVPLLAVTVVERAAVLDVILHIVYAIPLVNRDPNLDDILDAFDCLEKYSLSAPDEASDVWLQMVKKAEAHHDVIRAFAVAASCGMDRICVQISPFTLSTPLREVSQKEAMLMGPLYLRRLLRFHMQKQTALKSAIRAPPAVHPPTPTCSEGDQLRVRQRWELVGSDVMIRPTPQSVSQAELRSMFENIATGNGCQQCVANILKRVQEVVEAWQGSEPSVME